MRAAEQVTGRDGRRGRRLPARRPRDAAQVPRRQSPAALTQGPCAPGRPSAPPAPRAAGSAFSRAAPRTRRASGGRPARANASPRRRHRSCSGCGSAASTERAFGGLLALAGTEGSSPLSIRLAPGSPWSPRGRGDGGGGTGSGLTTAGLRPGRPRARAPRREDARPPSRSAHASGAARSTRGGHRGAGASLEPVPARRGRPGPAHARTSTRCTA